MKRLLIALTAALAFSAQAQFVTGNSLLSSLKSDSPGERIWALGYITGTLDVADGDVFCLPSGVEVGQMRDMVQYFLENKPAVRHHNAAALVGYLLEEAYPCKKGGGV